MDDAFDTIITNPGIGSRLAQDTPGFSKYHFAYVENTNESDSAHCGVFKSTVSNERDCCKICIDVPSASLIPTIGPFLRTLVRLTDGIDPRTICVEILMSWVTAEPDEGRAVAHHIHMMVRNSMAAALFLTRWKVILPRDLEVSMVKSEMTVNPHVNYPTVQILQAEPVSQVTNCDPLIMDKGKSVAPIQIQKYLHEEGGDGFIELCIPIRTKMCTVRFTPIIYELARRLRAVSSISIQKPILPPELLLMVCVDKVANLYRIILLIRDYQIFCQEICRYRLVLITRNESIRKRLHDEAIKFVSGLDDGLEDAPQVITLHDAVAVATGSNLVAIDLDPNASLLDEASSTFEKARILIWGFEKDGIPTPLLQLASHFIEIPSRTSINLVSSISIVLHSITSS